MLLITLSTFLHALDRPGEVRDRDNEEAACCRLANASCIENSVSRSRSYLLESSSIPARALYQAMNAANNAKNPPALMTGGFGEPAALGFKYPMASSKKAMSRKKNSRKNATVERRVANRRRVVKIHHPYPKY